VEGHLVWVKLVPFALLHPGKRRLARPIVIHGPSTANWDIDPGPLLMTDYYHESVFDRAQQPLIKSLGISPVVINGLTSGRNTHEDGGKRHELHFTPGKKHLHRLVNASFEVTFRFGIDHHKMTIVSADFVPIQPYGTKMILVTVG
jgi:FtsP/CotA-like multicopper oxidase with cupredoxin domain